MHQNISVDEFMKSFLSLQKYGERFCFFLGAGASVESNIPSAYKLVKMWDLELSGQDSETTQKWHEWKAQNNIYDDNMANYYSDYYSWRFPNETEGHRYLQSILQNSLSNRGYGMLANILVNTQHNIVITTNFDQLVQREVYRLNRDCIAITHENIVGTRLSVDIINSVVPVIIKLHRDLYLNPLNRPNELKELPGGWISLLEEIFREYHVIFLGYAGNDPNVFAFLTEKAKLFARGELRQPFWFLYDDTGNHQTLALEIKRLSAFLDDSNSFVIPHKGFSWSIGKIFEGLYDIPELDWRSTSSEMLADLHRLSPLHQRTLLDKCLKIYKHDFIALSAYSTLEESEMNYDAAEKYYELAIKANPFSIEAIGNYAVFLENCKMDFQKADFYYNKALNLTTKDAILLGNYAEFLETKLHNYELADEYYCKALDCEINPNIEYIAFNYGEFLITKIKDYEKAIEFYENFIQYHHDIYNVVGAYAMFCHTVTRDYDKAEILYKKYVEFDKTSSAILGYYALYLDDIKHDETAERYYELAIEIDRENSLAYGNYATCLSAKGNSIKAERCYSKAIEFEPNCADWHSNYAVFLDEVKKDVPNAQKHYIIAIELAPESALIHNNYALFLWETKHDAENAKKHFRRAIELDPNCDEWKNDYIDFCKEST